MLKHESTYQSLSAFTNIYEYPNCPSSWVPWVNVPVLEWPIALWVSLNALCALRFECFMCMKKIQNGKEDFDKLNFGIESVC